MIETQPARETPKPTVFIASSKEGQAIAGAIATGVAHVAEATTWFKDPFPLSTTTVEGLMEFLERFDFAVFVFTADETVRGREKEYAAPRANVVFELGLFTGRLGRRRCFIVCDGDLVPTIFSDVNGVTFAVFEAPADESMISAAVGPACGRISTAIAAIGPLPKSGNSVPAYLQPFFTNGFRLIMGAIRKFDAFEPSGLIGLGDAMGLADIRAYFDTVGIRDFPLHFSDATHGDRLRGNLLLLGGPGPNTITREVLKKVPTNIREATRSDSDDFALHDSQTGRVYEPTFGEDGQIESDVGLIISSANPFDAKHRSIVIYGITGFGTWAATRFFASDEFEAVVRGEHSFEVLVVSDIVLGSPQKVREVVVRAPGLP